MASSLLLLLDDIATVLDDVAVMSKMAAKKTAGVLGIADQRGCAVADYSIIDDWRLISVL